MATPVCIVGTVATVPRFSRTGEKAALCSFRLASHDRRYDRERGVWVDSEVNWLTVSAFRGLAEHAHASFAKGDRVIVSGRLRIRKWEAEERSGTTVEIEAEALGHDLRWGVSSFTRQLPRQDTSGSHARGEGNEAPSFRRTESPAPVGPAATVAPAASAAHPAELTTSPERQHPAGDGFIPSAA